MGYRPTWWVIAVCELGTEEVVYVGQDHELAQLRRERALKSPLGYISVELTNSYSPSVAPGD